MMHPLFILLRLTIPPLILRNPVIGSLCALMLDGLDWYGSMYLGGIDYVQYQFTDKFLDLYYLSFAAYVCLFWKEAGVRTVALSLFLIRVIGVILFEYTHKRWFLVLFPNLFESFYLAWLIVRPIFLRQYVPRVTVATSVFVIGIPKMIQEYQMHIVGGSAWQHIILSWSPVQIDYDVLYAQFVFGILFISILMFKKLYGDVGEENSYKKR